MLKLPAFTCLHEAIKKVTRCEQLCVDMCEVVLWDRLWALIDPYYSKTGSKGGRSPMQLDTMMRYNALSEAGQLPRRTLHAVRVRQPVL